MRVKPFLKCLKNGIMEQTETRIRVVRDRAGPVVDMQFKAFIEFGLRGIIMTDLTGSVFGELTVVGFSGKNAHGQALWLCRCSCGKQKVLTGGNLRSGQTNSCGHIRRSAAMRYVGSVFGKTEVLSVLDQKSRGNGLYVRCKCTLCGKEFETAIINLKKGFCQSCGCDKFEDLTGQRFGNITVIEFLNKNAHGHSTWRCKCDCGKEITATTSNLKVGSTVSCGCRKRDKAHDMIGKVYGYTKVTGILETISSEGGTIAEAQCLKCGKGFRILTHTLKRGYVSSCGCYNKEVLEKARDERQYPEGRQKIGLFEGTRLPSILSTKLSIRNTTGVKGVYCCKGRYIASIGFQSKSYYLGSYDTLAEAASARKFAEEKLISPIFQRYLKDVKNKGNWIKKFINETEAGEAENEIER